MPAQVARRRAARPAGSGRGVAASTGSTSCRSAASERLRSRRSTSASHHSRAGLAPGRNSPSTTRRSAASRRSVSSTTAMPRPSRVGGVGGGERAVGAGVAADEVAERVGDRLDEGDGHADRQRHAEGVAQPGGVLDDGPALDAGDRDARGRGWRAASSVEAHASAVARTRTRSDSQPRSASSSSGQRAEQPQQVDDALGVRAPGGPGRGAAARARSARSPPGRAARAARPGRAARRAASGRGDSAAARRSASGESPSYMNAAT